MTLDEAKNVDDAGHRRGFLTKYSSKFINQNGQLFFYCYLALEHENSLLIIDERKGRAIAKKMGLKITGILGVIIKAKELGIIKEAKPIIEKLEKVEFRISNSLKRKILQRLNEH